MTWPTQKDAAGDEAAIVFIVEDDTSFRDALRRLFHTVDLRTEVFGSAAEFLQHKLPDVPACLILDVRLPGLSGLDIQRELAKGSNIGVGCEGWRASGPGTVQRIKVA